MSEIKLETPLQGLRALLDSWLFHGGPWMDGQVQHRESRDEEGLSLAEQRRVLSGNA